MCSFWYEEVSPFLKLILPQQTVLVYNTTHIYFRYRMLKDSSPIVLVYLELFTFPYSTPQSFVGRRIAMESSRSPLFPTTIFAPVISRLLAGLY